MAKASLRLASTLCSGRKGHTQDSPHPVESVNLDMARSASIDRRRRATVDDSNWRYVMRRFAVLLCCTVIASLGLAGCAPGGAADTYKIGFVASQTGPYTVLGVPALEGAQLVVKQINDDGGINGKMLELVLYDDKGTATDTALAAQKLIEVDEVVTLACITATGLSHGMVPILNENETPGLIMSGTGLIDSELGEWAFKPTSSEEDYIPLPLGYLKDDVGVTNFAGMIENRGYGEGGEH
ncbi:MAG: ABC transporter substrate-binding protein [Dehalococcoidia bacterium]|nr:MAG: ABC transporter substrate-binding protein [Dehalococcoidia bacterium]